MNIAIIPARGGSKRIPRKNIKYFCGKPIIVWSIETASASNCFDKIIVSTDDDEIAAISRNSGAEVPFSRPANLSGDYSDTISVGLDYIPLSADVSKSTKKRTDVESSVSGTTTTTSTSRTNEAQAELNNHVTLYSNYMLSDTMFLKAGVAFVELDTNESLGTGSKYGSDDIYGAVVGIGAKNDNIRVELLYTDYEDISIRSSVARTDVSPNNLIEADIDATLLSASLGYKF